MDSKSGYSVMAGITRNHIFTKEINDGSISQPIF